MNPSPVPTDLPPSATSPGLPPQAQKRRRKKIVFAAVLVLLAVLSSPLTMTRPQRELAKSIENIESLFDDKVGAGEGTTASLEILRSAGLPKAIAHLKADVVVAAPDRLWLRTTVERQPIEMARNKDRIWIWQGAKGFGVVGERGVARFASNPEGSRDATELPSIRLPLTTKLLPIAPRLLSVSAGESEELNGERCHALRASPFGWITQRLKLAPATLTVWVRDADGWPVQVGYQDEKGADVLVAISHLRVRGSVAEGRWQAPPESEGRMEKVALSHLVNFYHAALNLATLDVKPLGPVRGEVKVIARHGKGRLESHDGARVLFLRGTPEEMGEQHGTLLKPEVRSLVERVLYGVGVGSSFAKGRWFFGEIEQCQARLSPFIDPRHLREMDAMANAAGLEKEEMRLANFFPELFHCSGFALMGDATAGGHIYHGRILDYLKGVGLEANAVVTVNQPDQGHAWVNVGYVGFVGSVTAMNDQKISIGEMGGRGEGNWDGKPMAQLVREVMEKASTLDEAIEIMQRGPRTCEYFYVIADGKTHTAVGIAATPERLDVLHPGEAHPRLPTPVQNAVVLSAGDRYTELVRRVQAGYGRFDDAAARELMTRPVCMNSNIHSVLFEPDTLDFWVANADSRNVASANRYTHYNLAELLK